MKINRLMALSALLTVATQSFAASVYVLRGGSDAVDNAVKAALIAQGHEPTLGGFYYQETLSANYFQYDVIYFQPNANWNGNFQPGVEQKLVDYINGGGAFVTSEWALWMTAALGYFQTLKNAYAVLPTTSYSGGGTMTLTQDVADPIINSNLPTSLTFPVDNFSGSYTNFATLVSGAIPFYKFDATHFGVVGIDNGNGRVVNFASCNGPSQLADPKFQILFGNVFEWVSAKPTPGPGVKGKIDFTQSNSPGATTAVFTYRRTDNSFLVGRTVGQVDANGNFDVPGPAVPGSYTLGIKSGHWLRKRINVTTVASQTPDVGTVSLINGDVDGDNTVSVFDYIILSDSFDLGQGDPGFAPGADLDEDDVISVFDYIILSDNFDREGDI